MTACLALVDRALNQRGESICGPTRAPHDFPSWHPRTTLAGVSGPTAAVQGLRLKQEGLEMSDHASAAPAPVVSGRPTGSDKAFLAFLFCVLLAVAVMGTFNFREGLKTEAGKSQGETLAKWLSQSKDKRGQVGFEPAACASARTDVDKPPTWADCSKALFGPGGPMGDFRNAFSGQPIAFLTRCDRSGLASQGQLVLEKITATAPGSAVSSVTLALAADDPIDKVLTVKITVCDKGGYPIKVAEVEF